METDLVRRMKRVRRPGSLATLVQNGAVANPTIDRELDFVGRAERLPGVERVGQQRSVIKAISPKHTTARFGHDFNAEFRENGAAALAMLEAREVYQHGEDPVLTLEVGLEVISMGSVLLAVFIPDQLQHLDVAGGQLAQPSHFFRNLQHNWVSARLVHECRGGRAPLRLRFRRLPILGIHDFALFTF